MNEKIDAPAEAKPAKAAKAPNKGGRPRKDVTKTAEFEQAVKAAEQRIIAALASAREGRAPEGVEAGDREMIQRLALTFAEIADQGSGRKRIAPDLIAKRQAAYNRMLDIIVREHARGWPNERPIYRVLSAVYINEQLVQPYVTDPATKQVEPQVIEWEGLPNEALEPLNDIAKQIHIEYRQYMGEAQSLTPNADTRPMAVTPSGLVVRSTGFARRQMGTVQPEAAAPSNERRPDFNEGFTHKLGIKGVNDPRAKEVRVLGTVAKPAQQTAV